VQVTRQGGYAAAEALDGRVVYYAKLDQPGIWQCQLDRGEEMRILNHPESQYWGGWAVTDKGIYYLNPQTPSSAALEFYDLATRQVTQITTLENKLIRWAPALTASRDGQWFCVAQTDRSNSDLMLVDDLD
jgi:hypothetical protein